MRLERRKQLPSNHKQRRNHSSGSDSGCCSRHTTPSAAGQWDSLMSPAGPGDMLLAFDSTSPQMQLPVPYADDKALTVDILEDLLAAGLLDSSSAPSSNCSSQHAGLWACPAAGYALTSPSTEVGVELQACTMQDTVHGDPPMLSSPPSWISAQQMPPAAPMLAPAAFPAAPAQSGDFSSMMADFAQGLEGDSSQDLELMLESELIAALLDSAIAHAPALPMDPAAQRVSAQLAELLVQDSGLFSPAGQDAQLSTGGPGALHSQRSFSASNYSAESSLPCSDSGDGSAAALMRANSSNAATMLATAGQIPVSPAAQVPAAALMRASSSNAAAMLAAAGQRPVAPAAARSPAAPCFGMCFAPAAPCALQQQHFLQVYPAAEMAAAAPSACSGAPAVAGFLAPSTAMPAQMVPVGYPALGSYGQLAPQPFAVPVAMQLQPTYPAGQHAAQRPGLFVGQEGRLNAMQQQVRLLHASVQRLKSQLGM